MGEQCARPNKIKKFEKWLETQIEESEDSDKEPELTIPDTTKKERISRRIYRRDFDKVIKGADEGEMIYISTQCDSYQRPYRDYNPELMRIEEERINRNHRKIHDLRLGITNSIWNCGVSNCPTNQQIL